MEECNFQMIAAISIMSINIRSLAVYFKKRQLCCGLVLQMLVGSMES